MKTLKFWSAYKCIHYHQLGIKLHFLFIYNYLSFMEAESLRGLVKLFIHDYSQYILDPKKNRLRNVENLWSAHSACHFTFLSTFDSRHSSKLLHLPETEKMKRKVVETLKCARDLQMAALRQTPGPRGRTSTGLEHPCSFNALIKKSSVRLHRHNITDSSLHTKTQHWPHQTECAAQT